jgi:hypothetical protein
LNRLSFDIFETLESRTVPGPVDVALELKACALAVVAMSAARRALAFTATNGSIFTTITLPSTGAGSIDVSVDGIDLGQFQPGAQIDFANYSSLLGGLLIGDPGVASFDINGVNGVTSLPICLTFDSSSGSFSVAAIPEPATLGVAVAFTGVVMLKRRRPASGS